MEMTQLGSGVEKRVGAMMSAEEAEEIDHIKSLSTLVAVSGRKAVVW